MPLTRVKYPYADDIFLLPTIASNAINGSSSFLGPVSFAGPVSFSNTTAFSSINGTSITGSTINATNIFVSELESIGTVNQLAQLTITATLPSRKGLVIRQPVAASVNPFELQNSAGTEVFRIDTSGNTSLNSGTASLTAGSITANYFLSLTGQSFTAPVGKYFTSLAVGTTSSSNPMIIYKTPTAPNTEAFVIVNNSGTNQPLFAISENGEIQNQNNSTVPLRVNATSNKIMNINSISGTGSVVSYTSGTTSDNNFVIGSTVTVFGASTAGFNGTFTITAVTQNSFSVSNTTTGASSSATAVIAQQVADLQQWRNSAATSIGGVNAVGQIYSGSTTTINTQVGGAVTGASHNGTTATLNLTSASNLAVGDQIVVSGFTPAGYNGTHIVSAVSNTPTFSVSYATPNPGTTSVLGIVSAPAQNSVIARSAGTIGQVIRGAASQAVDFMQFRDSSNNIIASFTNLGALLLPAATTSTTSLRVPHGTAPTTPTNGDIWTTTTGLFVRVNGATVGPLAAGFSNPMTTLGDTIYGGASGTPTRLAGNAVNGVYFLRSNVTASASVAPDWIGSTGSTNVVLSTSPTITTPTIDTINVSGAAIAAALWNTTLTTGSISMGGALTTGGVNIATGTAFNGTVAIATGAGTVNKTVNIGTSSTTGTTAITLGSSSGATSTIQLNGAVTTNSTITTGGQLNLNYASPTIASNNASAATIFGATVTGVTIGTSAIKTTEYPSNPSGTTSGTVTQSAQLNGYKGMPINQQGVAATALAYTLVAADAGKMIYVQSTPTTPTITIPANSAVAFEIGTTIVIMNDIGAATNVSINITTDTLQLVSTGATGTRTLARYGMCTLVKVTATKWIITGNGVT